MEYVNLTTPITQLQIVELNFYWRMNMIKVVVGLPDGNDVLIMYSGQIAHDLMLALNKTDNSVKSMHRRILEYLINDGKLVGTISGAPD